MYPADTSNAERYSDYPLRIKKVDLPNSLNERRPFQDVPNRNDPRRAESWNHFLEVERSRPFVSQPSESVQQIQEVDSTSGLPLLAIDLPEKLPVNPAHIPNVRDPRRYTACHRAGYEDADIGPVNLVEFAEGDVECAVLVIDLSDWPDTVSSRIETIPHECNILRVQQFGFEGSDTSLEVLEEVTESSARASIEILEEEQPNFYIDTLGNQDKPMQGLELDDGGIKIEAVVPRKRNSSQELQNRHRRRLRPRLDGNVDLVDLSDDDVREVPVTAGSNCNVVPMDIVSLSDDDEDETREASSVNLGEVTEPAPAAAEQATSTFSPPTSNSTGDQIPFLEDAKEENSRPFPRPRVIKNTDCTTRSAEEPVNVESFVIDQNKTYLTGNSILNYDVSDVFKKSNLGDVHQPPIDPPALSNLPEEEVILSSRLIRIFVEQELLKEYETPAEIRLVEVCDDGCEFSKFDVDEDSLSEAVSYSSDDFVDLCVSDASEASASDSNDDDDYDQKLVVKMIREVQREENKENLSRVSVPNGGSSYKSCPVSAKQSVKESLNARARAPPAIVEAPPPAVAMPSPDVISSVIGTLNTQNLNLPLLSAAISEIQSKSEIESSLKAQSAVEITKRSQNKTKPNFKCSTPNKSKITSPLPPIFDTRSRSSSNSSGLQNSDVKRTQSCQEVAIPAKKPRLQALPQGFISLHPQVRNFIERFKNPVMQQAAGSLKLTLPCSDHVQYSRELSLPLAAGVYFCLDFIQKAANEINACKKFLSIEGVERYSNKPKEDWCTIEEIVEKVENCDMELSPEPLTLRKKLCEENKTVKLINSNTNEEIAKENSSCFQKEINLDVITSSNILNVKSSTDNLKYSFKVDLIKRRHSLPTIIAPQHKKKPRLQSLESTSSSFFTIDEKLNQDTCIIQTPKLSSNVPEEKSFDENLNSNKSISNEVPELECNDLENRPFTSIRDKIHNLHKGLSSTLKQKVKRKISDESLNEFISKKNKAEKIYNEALCNIVDSSVKKPSIKILSIENYNQNNANENKSFNISSSMCQKKPKTKCNIFNFNKSSCNNSSMDVTPSLIDDKLSSALPSPPISIDGKESEKEEIQFNNMPVKVSSVIIDYSKLGSVLPSPVDTDFDCSNDSIDANKLTINENDHYNNISSVTEAKDGEKEEIDQSKDSQTDDDLNISQLNHKNSPLENSSRAPSPDFDCSNDSIDVNKLTINENDHYNNISSVTEAKDGEKEEIEQSKDSQTDDDHNISQLNHKNSPLENSSRAPSPDSQGTVIKSHKLPEENFKDSSYPDSTLEGYQEGDLIYAELDRFQDLNYAEDDYDVIYNGGDDYYNDKAKKQVSDQVDETVIKNEEIVQVNQNYNKSHESDSDIEIEIIQVIEKQSSNNKTSISKKESEVVLESCNKEVAKESLAAVTEKSNDLIKTKNSCHKEVAKESLAAVIEKSNDLIKTKNSCHKEVAKESFPAVTHKSNDPIKTKNSNEISEKIFLINEGRANQHIDIEDLIISSCEMQESDGFDILIEESPAMSEFFDLCSLTVNDRTFEPSLNNNRISQLQKLSEYFENIDSLEKYYMFVESKMQDEVVQNNLFNKEVQTVNELLTTLINDSCNVEEIIENYETVDTDILHTKLCAIQNLKVNNSLLKQLSLNFIDADNSSHTHNKNTTDQNTNKTLLDSVINTTADNTLPNIPSLSLKVRNLSELVEKPNRVTAENTDKTSQLKETMDNNTIEITLPPQYQANPIIIQQPLQPTQPSILQSIQQPILHLIQQPVQQPIQQILNMITKAVPQHALQANTILRPPIVNTQQPIPPKNTTSTSSSSSDINKSPNQNKPVMLFASKMFENIESTSPTSTSRIDQNPLTVYQLELPPYEKLKKLRIPSPFKVGREENFSQLNFKLSAYKKLLLDKIKSCLYNLDRKKFKSNAQDLLHQNVITEDTWRFQSSILSIAQCITRIHNLCVFSTTDITINAIMNSEQLESMKSFISTDVLKNILTVYDKLEKKGIFSSNVINQCPLYEELPQPEQDQFTQKVKSKFEKMMWTQAEQYKKIHDETAKQLQKLQNKNSSLQKKPLDQKNILPTSKNKSKEKKSQQSESFLSNNSVSGEIDISSKCLKCGKQTEIVCNNCKNAAYCSRECQNEHWNEEHHKKCK